MPIKEIGQSSFLAGAINDPRSTNPQGVWYAENVELGKRKSVKQVVNNSENPLAYDVNNNIIKIIEAEGFLFGLGQNNNTNHYSTIWKKTAALTGNWAAAENGTTSDVYVVNTANVAPAAWVTDPFMSYSYPDIYFNNGPYLAKYNISTNTMTAHLAALPSSGVYGFRGGLKWNGVMYAWWYNHLATVAADGTITDLSLAISAGQVIVDVLPYGDILMIICTSLSTTEKSKAYSYDGSTLGKAYEIGAGDVFGAAYFDGQLIVGMTAKNKRAIYLIGFNGVHYRSIYTYSAREDATATPYAYIAGASLMKIFGNYIYFLITGTKPSGSYANHWEYALARFGRDDINNPLAFSLYKSFDFAGARGVDGQTAKNDFIVLGGITGSAAIPEAYIAAVIYSDANKSTLFLSSASTFSAQAAVIETFEWTGSSESIVKQLKAVSLAYRPIPTGGSVVLKYRVNGGAWVTIFTDNVAGSVKHSAVCVESTGANFDEFNYVQFRLELLGGVELTEIKAKYEELSQESY